MYKPHCFICNDHLDLHTSGPGNHMSRISKNTDLLQVLFEDLKMIKVKIIEKSDIEIKKILEQANNSIKEINNCIKNLEENLDIDETC